MELLNFTVWQQCINGWLRARKIFGRGYRKNIYKGKMGKSIKLTTDTVQYIENVKRIFLDFL